MKALVKIGDGRAVGPLLHAQNISSIDVEWRLIGFGENALGPLIAALDDEDSGVRLRAASVLGKIGDERAVEPLVAAMHAEKDHGRKLELRRILARLDWEPRTDAERIAVDLDRLLSEAMRASARLSSADPDEKWDKLAERCAGADNSLVTGVVMEPLVKALRSTRHKERRGALAALKRLGWRPRNPTEAALEALADYDYDALATMGRTAVEPLVSLVLASKQVDEPKEAALSDLGAMGDGSSYRPLPAFAMTNREHAAGAVSALQQLLRHNASSVATDDLTLTLELSADVIKRAVPIETIGPYGSQVARSRIARYDLEPVDLSELKTLAKTELSKRGLLIPDWAR
jgi:HEAT repeat protein